MGGCSRAVRCWILTSLAALDACASASQSRLLSWSPVLHLLRVPVRPGYRSDRGTVLQTAEHNQGCRKLHAAEHMQACQGLKEHVMNPALNA